MSLYSDYLEEIETRKQQGLKPKPIEDSALIRELVSQIEDQENAHRSESLEFFIFNTIPGTTSAAGEKAKLKTFAPLTAPGAPEGNETLHADPLICPTPDGRPA